MNDEKKDCGCHGGDAEGHRCEHHRPHHPQRGWVGLIFLRLLDEKPMHGYQLMDELNKRGLADPEKIEPGAVYTVLRRMEHRGLLTSQWEEKETGPDRRVYSLTEEGREHLKAGLKMMLRRKAVMDDLSAYYDAHYKTQ
ncbi:MAG: PadR family transcriptional regulator [Candidatus Bathyarchaeia archaeon]